MIKNKLVCKRCGHIWMSSISPIVCPKCHLNWRELKKIVGRGTKKTILDYLDNLKKHYGASATLSEVVDDLNKIHIEL